MAEPAPLRTEGFTAALRRGDPLAWGGLAAAFVLVAFPVYYTFASLVPLFGGSEGHAADFVYYFRAGHRIRTHPLTLYADPSFLYPPPSSVLFALVSWLPLAWGYVVFGALTLAALAASLRVVETLLPQQLVGWARAAWWAVGLASAPALQNVKFGQVNAFVLLLALVFVRAVARPDAGRRALVWAGGGLAAGAWLKLYPLALALLAVRRRTWPALAGLTVGLVALPLLALPLVPLSLYAEFALDVLPSFAGAPTPATLNAGLPALVERIYLPPEALRVYRSAPFGAAAQATATVALVGGVAAVAAAWARGWPTAWAGLAILAVLPVASTFAWEYTFVLALPAVLALLLVARDGSPGVRLAATACVGAWLVQKPPEGVVAWAIAHLPEAVVEGFAARLVVALAVLAGCAWWTRRAAEPAGRLRV